MNLALIKFHHQPLAEASGINVDDEGSIGACSRLHLNSRF
jgi:hypothetical protein